MTTQVRFASTAGGQPSQLEGALAEPAGAAKAGGIAVAQEWWGLSEYIKSTCDRLAEAGFLALAPDFFHGKRPASKQQAAQMTGELDKKVALAEIGEAVAFLKKHPRSNGKVAVVGFCLGGGLTFAAARHLGGLAAAVPFYGLPGVSVEEFAQIRVPVQAHFAKRDDWAKASVAEEIQKQVRAGGGQMDLHVYDAGHAFMRTTDPEVYDAQNAPIAWERMVGFLKKTLG